jgi:hypothetical protein
MARRKKKVKTNKAVRARRVSGGRRSGAGRKSIEVHFAALSDLLNERFAQLFAALGKELPTTLPPERDVAEAPEAPAPEEKPRKRRVKIVDAPTEQVEAAPAQPEANPSAVAAPIPPPITVAPVQHPASPEVVAPQNPWAVPGPSAPAPAPENGANSFESQFAALNKS